MERRNARNRSWALAVVALGGIALTLGARAGSFLVLDEPRRSDVILVMAGEANHRPERALELLSQGFAGRIVLDVSTNAKIYEFPQIQLAEKYVHDLPPGTAVSVCPIHGLSTRDEAQDAARCLAGGDSGRILIVTSDFHTRRALSVLRHEVSGHEYSVAAARDPEQFGTRWWTHRQWAKTFIDEWLRLIWWKSIDQWR